MQQIKNEKPPKRRPKQTNEVVNVRRASERVHMQQVYFGMLLFAKYIGEPDTFAQQCFHNYYPEKLSEARLRAIGCEALRDYFSER